MKLIVTGATGFVGTEIIRLALQNLAITSVVALARRPVQPPANAASGADASKLHSVVLDDWTAPYPESVKRAISGADACIWTLAITPTKSQKMDFADVERICSDFTVNGLTNMAVVANKPFRFVYTSAILVERDQSKSLTFLSEYRHMRGRVENAVLQFAEQHAPDVEVTVTKPGSMDGPDRGGLVRTMKRSANSMFGPTPSVHVSEIAATMIDQCLNGITKDPLVGTDILEIGQRVLRKEDYVQ